jgi:hypothetical protein
VRCELALLSVTEDRRDACLLLSKELTSLKKKVNPDVPKSDTAVAILILLWPFLLV